MVLDIKVGFQACMELRTSLYEILPPKDLTSKDNNALVYHTIPYNMNFLWDLFLILKRHSNKMIKHSKMMLVRRMSS